MLQQTQQHVEYVIRAHVQLHPGCNRTSIDHAVANAFPKGRTKPRRQLIDNVLLRDEFVNRNPIKRGSTQIWHCLPPNEKNTNEDNAMRITKEVQVQVEIDLDTKTIVEAIISADVLDKMYMMRVLFNQLALDNKLEELKETAGKDACDMVTEQFELFLRRWKA